MVLEMVLEEERRGVLHTVWCLIL